MGLFRKDTKLEKKNKARRIMMNSGWFEKYYYILKVIRSCESSNNTQSPIKARKWGIDVLRKEYDVICKTPKAKKVKIELDEIFFIYTETVYDIYEKVFSKVINNMRNFKPDEKRKNYFEMCF